MNVEVLGTIAWMLTGTVIFVTIGWTVRHWVDRHYDSRRRATGEVGGVELARLTERMGELEEQVSGRILDLAERLDFTERVLAQSRERPQLGER
jgi:hypothetical protein